MSVESSLVAHLTADGGVSAVAGDRLYPEKLPQAAVLEGPSLTYQVVSENPMFTHDGPSSPEWTRVQIDVHAHDHATKVLLRNLVKTSLNGLKGDMGGLPVQGIYWDGGRDFYEDEPDIYRHSMDFRIWHAKQ